MARINPLAFAVNTVRKIPIYLSIFRLRLRNRYSRASITGEGGPTVSLTTHGLRLKNVFLAIESIARGSLKPSRLMLYLDVEEHVLHPLKTLQRLQRRGLENLGPHTKIQPWIANAPSFSVPHVVVDDDILYPRWWLERLSMCAASDSVSIHAYRTHRMVAADDGMSLTAYDTWPPGLGKPSNLHFATGCSGIMLPPAFLQIMRDVGQGFRETCPRADDIWLTYLAIEHRIPISQVDQKSLHFDVIPGTQVTSLNASNVFEGQNDQQIKSTFQPSTLERIVELERLEGYRT
jgi:hypothetical protein